MTGEQTAADRIKFLRERVLRLSQREFARALGYSPGLIGQIETAKIGISPKFVGAIQDRFGASPDWVLGGHGEILLPPNSTLQARHGLIEKVDPARPDHGDIRFHGVEYAFARRMALSISAGSGLTPIDEGEAEGVAFPVAWLRRQGINSDLAVLVSVKGDSMAPAIPDGALVLIHVAERSIASAGIYAFNLDGESYVKRIVPQSSGVDGRPGAVAVLADNPAYPPIVLSGPELNRMTIVGRVRAVIAEV